MIGYMTFGIGELARAADVFDGRLREHGGPWVHALDRMVAWGSALSCR